MSDSKEVKLAYRPLVFSPEIGVLNQKMRDQSLEPRTNKARLVLLSPRELRFLHQFGFTLALTELEKGRQLRESRSAMSVAVSGVSTVVKKKHTYLSLDLEHNEEIEVERTRLLSFAKHTNALESFPEIVHEYKPQIIYATFGTEQLARKDQILHQLSAVVPRYVTLEPLVVE